MGIVACASLLTFTLWMVPSAQASSPTFAIRMVQPENQIDPSRDFFDLQTYPGGSQVIQVELFNLSDQPIRIRARVSTATTNSQVQAEYREMGRPRDSTLPHPMEELVTMSNPEVTIEGGSSVYFPLQIQMPEKGYDGVLAGGINFQMVREETQLEGIELLVSFTKVILLWQGEIQEPELVLHQVETIFLETRADIEAAGLNIEPEREDGSKLVFTGHLQNIQAAFAHDVNIQTQISNLSTGELVFEERRSQLQIVPHSSFTFYTFASPELFQEGDYRITYFIESGGGNWEFQREIFVEGTRGEGASRNLGVLRAEDRRFPVGIYIMILILVVLTGITFVLWYNKI